MVINFSSMMTLPLLKVEVVRVSRDREPLAFSRHYSGSRESSRGR